MSNVNLINSPIVPVVDYSLSENFVKGVIYSPRENLIPFTVGKNLSTYLNGKNIPSIHLPDSRFDSTSLNLNKRIKAPLAFIDSILDLSLDDSNIVIDNLTFKTIFDFISRNYYNFSNLIGNPPVPFEFLNLSRSSKGLVIGHHFTTVINRIYIKDDYLTDFFKNAKLGVNSSRKNFSR